MPLKLDKIPISPKLEATVKSSLDKLKNERRKKIRKRIWMGIGSTAAAFIIAILFCVSNPSLAAKLPFVGSLFSDLQDDFAYPGDYSDRAQVLTPTKSTTPAESEADTVTQTNTSAAIAESDASPSELYTVTDQGITLTASEVYCDGISVFLSLSFFSEEPMGFFYDETGSPIPAHVYLSGSALIDAEEAGGDGELGNTSFHIEQPDEHNFSGMLKINLPDSIIGSDGSHNLTIRLNTIGADFADINKNPVIVESNPIGASMWVKGSWEVSFSFNADVTELQIYDDLNPEQTVYGISTVYISPYQIKAIFLPDYEAFENEGACMSGLSLFDQDGNVIQCGDNSSSMNSACFPLEGKRPTQLRFYHLEDWIDACKTTNEEAAASQALTSLSLDISWP
ncbi:DUF4179 domain-containing protein [Qiania dongpingensis]|uniref:DUF4179 domain-containing protein n=1 Tax=Qiania dongpingensis TaxID=2763669 RepID=A0A7G9G471_9FIRM|nr:DUF4179 domain-containing protein [Qiania dongpingensis]QNM05603.1 DUF4179 domain-containing protein [Qiania dongpingensis]